MQRRADGIAVAALGQVVGVDPVYATLVIQSEPMGHQDHAFTNVVADFQLADGAAGGGGHRHVLTVV